MLRKKISLSNIGTFMHLDIFLFYVTAFQKCSQLSMWEVCFKKGSNLQQNHCLPRLLFQGELCGNRTNHWSRSSSSDAFQTASFTTCLNMQSHTPMSLMVLRFVIQFIEISEILTTHIKKNIYPTDENKKSPKMHSHA